MQNGHLILIFASFLGLIMTWGVGANDLSNVLSTAMGSKAVKVRTAILIAIIFEVAGALWGGSAVSHTLRYQIINLDVIAQHNDPVILIHGMLAVMMASMSWIIGASYLGFPVSITNSIVGSIVGFGAIAVGVDAVHWHEVGYIAASWVIAPTVASILAFNLFRSIQYLILGQANPLESARRYMPIYFFLVGIVLSYITIFKALQHFHYDLSPEIDSMIAISVGIFTIIVGRSLSSNFSTQFDGKRGRAFKRIERMFAVLMGFTTCAMVFAHGANDISVAMGPLTVIISMLNQGNLAALSQASPLWVTLMGCLGVIVGLATYGWKVIETVGSGITALTPSRAFAATLAAASTVVVSTSIGLPVSTTQTLVGAVLGVGLARGIGALNLVVVRNIFMSWVITIPMASGLTVVFFHVLTALNV